MCRGVHICELFMCVCVCVGGGGGGGGVAVNIILHAQGHQGSSILSDHHRTMVFGPKILNL